MRGRLLLLGLLPVLLAAIAPGTRDARADEVHDLRDGVVETRTLPDGRATWLGRVSVPADATSLSLVACSPRDVDLYLRHGAPLDADLAREADVSARDAGPVEVVRLAAGSAVPLKPGTWYVAAARPPGSDNGAHFQIVALLERADGPRTLLPRVGAEQILPVLAGAPELRAFLPKAARAMTLSLRGADDPSVTYTLTGPEGYRRSGTAPGRFVLQTDDSPAGVYALDIGASDPSSMPEEIHVEAAWEYASSAAAVSTDALPIVRPGSAVALVLGGAGRTAARTVRIPVAAGLGGLRIEATNPAKADVDLRVRRDRPMRLGDQDADYFALSSAPSERLVIGGAQPLRSGTYYCEVVLVQGAGPVTVTIRVDAYRPVAGRGTWGEQDPPVLAPGRWTRGRVEAGLAGVTWYLLRAPKGTRSMHAVLLGATAPLDLVLARRTDGGIIRRALTARVDERIDHAFRRPLGEDTSFLLGVMNRNPFEDRVAFRVGLSFDRQPTLPADLRWPPVLDTEGLSAPHRVAAATVELTVRGNAGGSGTCVTPRGRILTCRHVLEVEAGSRAIQRQGILVAFPARLGAPPVQSYVARVTHEDQDLDLAMLEIVADVFGRRLRPTDTLPWVPLGDSSRLTLGDPLEVFGYPSEGSERSRTPVILTRGVVAGLESAGGRPRWIKTDAWVGLGHSGGAVVDGAHRLVGVAAATLGSSEGLGLAIPLTLVPPGWLAAVKKDVSR